MTWASGRSLLSYHSAAAIGPSEVDDLDCVAYWNSWLQEYDPPVPVGDGSHIIADNLFQWEGEGQPPEWCPPGPGALTYFVAWQDDDYLAPDWYALGTNDGGALDSVAIPVVNNTYPGSLPNGGVF